MIVGGGCRGRSLAVALVEEGHAVRITSREGRASEQIEAAGAECWAGDPDRLATMRGALDGVTVLAWLLGSADGSAEALGELHTLRLEFLLHQAIDTTVRGFLYEARGGSTPAGALASGEEIARAMCVKNAIPLAVLDQDPADPERWLAAALDAVQAFLAPA
jgi:uncharacterized protein YbjT (DUF2867 family)